MSHLALEGGGGYPDLSGPTTKKCGYLCVILRYRGKIYLPYSGAPLVAQKGNLLLLRNKKWMAIFLYIKKTYKLQKTDQNREIRYQNIFYWLKIYVYIIV